MIQTNEKVGMGGSSVLDFILIQHQKLWELCIVTFWKTTHTSKYGGRNMFLKTHPNY